MVWYVLCVVIWLFWFAESQIGPFVSNIFEKIAQCNETFRCNKYFRVPLRIDSVPVSRNHLELLKSIPLTIDTDINTVASFRRRAGYGARPVVRSERRIRANRASVRIDVKPPWLRCSRLMKQLCKPILPSIRYVIQEYTWLHTKYTRSHLWIYKDTMIHLQRIRFQSDFGVKSGKNAEATHTERPTFEFLSRIS